MDFLAYNALGSAGLRPALFVSARAEISVRLRGQGELARNVALVVGHFEDFVNRRDLDAIERNMSADFVDHDGPGGKRVGRAADRAMMAGMHAAFADLRVTVLDTVAQGDRVVVRNRWTGTSARSGERMECHGFVLWRVSAGKIVERWATVTPMQVLAMEQAEGA